MTPEQLTDEAIRLILFKSDLIWKVIPVAVLLTLTVAFLFIIILDRLNRSSKLVFGDWINHVSPKEKCIFYGIILGCTVLGGLVCVGLSLLGIYSG